MRMKEHIKALSLLSECKNTLGKEEIGICYKAEWNGRRTGADVYAETLNTFSYDIVVRLYAFPDSERYIRRHLHCVGEFEDKQDSVRRAINEELELALVRFPEILAKMTGDIL